MASFLPELLANSNLSHAYGEGCEMGGNGVYSQMDLRSAWGGVSSSVRSGYHGPQTSIINRVVVLGWLGRNEIEKEEDEGSSACVRCHRRGGGGGRCPTRTPSRTFSLTRSLQMVPCCPRPQTPSTSAAARQGKHCTTVCHQIKRTGSSYETKSLS